MNGDGPRCQVCNTPWAYHRGCQELCAEVQRLHDVLATIHELVLQFPSGIQFDANPNDPCPDDATAFLAGLIVQEIGKVVAKDE